MRLLLSFAIGVIFGLGLIISGMTQPAKVQGFLDVTGLWDPSLAFVMGGAVGVGLIAFRLAARRKKSVLDEPIRLPTAGGVDAPLLLGATIFGAGWGLSGVCPGPAIVNLGYFEPHTAVFVIAMASGMAIERIALFALRARAPIEAEQDG